MSTNAIEDAVITSPPAPTALAKSPPAHRPLISTAVIQQETEQRKLLGEYVKTNMVAGTDFGVIPGTDRPTLLKPGAEKLTDLFRCTPEYTFVEKVEDWDRPLFHYLIHCKVVSRDTGVVVAEGFGSANSREGKWRWRNGTRKCPSCGKEAIIKGKEEYGGGWLCYKAKGGCGSKWADGASEIERQEVGKVENDDVASVVNTVLKMAKKRALVDAAIALARCSDLFTQDAEDADHDGPQSPRQQPQQSQTNQQSRPQHQQQQQPHQQPQQQPFNDAPLVNMIEGLYNQCRTMDDLKAANNASRQNWDKISEEGRVYLKPIAEEARDRVNRPAERLTEPQKPVQQQHAPAEETADIPF